MVASKLLEIERHYENITSKLSQVMVDELTEAKKKAEKVLGFWEYDLDVDLDATDIRDLMNDIKNFYTEAELYGIAIEYRYETAEKYKENASEIVSALRILTTDFSSEAILDVICAFSSNPLKIIDSFIAYLSQVETDVSTVDMHMRAEKEQQIKQGIWSNEIDPRFELIESNFNILKGDALV